MGCGGDAAGGGGDSALGGDAGPLAWLPADTWLVATANADPDAIDEAVQTLDRLPAWALVEGFLPASDGAGLRRELLRAIADRTSEGADVTEERLEAAFGNRLGVALIDGDLARFDGNQANAPLAVWIEVDDEDAAIDVLGDLGEGDVERSEHEGRELWSSDGDDETAFTVDDGLAVIAPSRATLETLIEVREGDDSLAEDETARAVLEASVGDALVGVALQSTPLLEAAPQLIERAARESDDAANRAHGGALAERIGPALESDAVRDLVPDWSGGSLTIDDTGLVMRAAWTNPRDLAEPDVGARELVERAPAQAPIVQAMVSDGSMVRRMQDAWAETSDAAELDLADIAAHCPRASAWACELVVAGAAALLEDESLAEAIEDAGDTSFVMVQDLAPLLAVAAQAEQAGAAARAPRITSRFIEVATNGDVPDWQPPKQLRDAAERAGLSVRTNDDHTELTVRVTPGSPLARELQQASPSSLAAGAMFGLDLRRLTTREGLTLTAEQVDGLRVAGLPQDVPSALARSLAGDGDVLGDDEDYDSTVDAADVPDEVGAYGYVDVRGYVESLVGVLGAQEPSVQRIVPTLRNNLADIPGMLWWTAREEVDGTQVGVFEAVMPILD